MQPVTPEDISHAFGLHYPFAMNLVSQIRMGPKKNCKIGLGQKKQADSLDPSARSQFRAICYLQISARTGQAVAKATVMRILGIPRLPLQLFLPRAGFAWNRPGQAETTNAPTRNM